VTYVEDLVARVEEIIQTNRHGLYHVVNEGVCTYEDFAREAARLDGLSEEEAARLIETVTESEVKRPVRRPRYTPLRCTATAELGLPPLPHWREALAAYVSQT
jgi:dTDP-4-dehydrorhamnose reductase